MKFNLPEVSTPEPKVRRSTTPRKKRKKQDSLEFKPPHYDRQQKREDGTYPINPTQLTISDLDNLKPPYPDIEEGGGEIPVTALCNVRERDFIRSTCNDLGLPSWEWARQILVDAAIKHVKERNEVRPTESGTKETTKTKD